MTARSIIATIKPCLVLALTAYLVVIFLIKSALSFSWANGNDTSFLYYFSWLMNEHDYQPYVQVWDISFPGTFLTYNFITTLFGYSDLSFHIADMAILSLLLAITWAILKPIHVRVAAGAVLFFGIYYISSKESVHLQRDYLAILPAAAALLVAQRARDINVGLVSFLIGILFALSASIKPHFALGWPLVWMGAMLMNDPVKPDMRFRFWLTGMAATLAGFLFWLSVCAIWLITQGALHTFLDMALTYMPLYLHHFGGYTIASLKEDTLPFFMQLLDWPTPKWDLPQLAMEQGWPSFMQRCVMGIKPDWILATAAATWGLMNLPKQRQHIVYVVMLLCLCFVYVFYVALGSKGWNYHWMPFWYFEMLCVSLLLVPAVNVSSQKWWKLFYFIPVCVFVLYGYFRFDLFMTPKAIFDNIHYIKKEYKNYPQLDPSTADLESYMKAHTQPGERVGVRVTSTGGPFFHVLLAAELLPASRYQEQMMLYRNPGNAYTQNLKQTLLAELAIPPHFFLDDDQFSLLVNRDGSSNFLQYDQYLSDNYVAVYDNRKNNSPIPFVVYERKNN